MLNHKGRDGLEHVTEISHRGKVIADAAGGLLVAVSLPTGPGQSLYLICKYGYYLRRVLVYVQSSKAPLNKGPPE